MFFLNFCAFYFLKFKVIPSREEGNWGENLLFMRVDVVFKLMSEVRVPLVMGLLALIISCSKSDMNDYADNPNLELAVFGGGCFWCTEAVMERMSGVVDVKSGYMGGKLESPTYAQISTGKTGHVEVIQVAFDAEKISYAELLDVFWQAHDPTTLNQQGADHGPQYRSAIFYQSTEQKHTALQSKEALDESGRYANLSVTEITQAGTFWEAEKEHQDFYRNNPANGYCRMVIHPKLEKMDLVKE